MQLVKDSSAGHLKEILSRKTGVHPTDVRFPDEDCLWTRFFCFFKDKGGSSELIHNTLTRDFAQSKAVPCSISQPIVCFILRDHAIF